VLDAERLKEFVAFALASPHVYSLYLRRTSLLVRGTRYKYSAGLDLSVEEVRETDHWKAAARIILEALPTAEYLRKLYLPWWYVGSHSTITYVDSERVPIEDNDDEEYRRLKWEQDPVFRQQLQIMLQGLSDSNEDRFSRAQRIRMNLLQRDPDSQPDFWECMQEASREIREELLSWARRAYDDEAEDEEAVVLIHTFETGGKKEKRLLNLLRPAMESNRSLIHLEVDSRLRDGIYKQVGIWKLRNRCILRNTVASLSPASLSPAQMFAQLPAISSRLTALFGKGPRHARMTAEEVKRHLVHGMVHQMASKDGFDNRGCSGKRKRASAL
jgi:hypothetical protein